MTFALAPFLIVVVEIVGLVLGSGNHARNEIVAIISRSAGKSAGQALGSIVDGILAQRSASIWAAIISWIVLILSAAGLFGAIQDALNTVFGAPSTRGGLWLLLRDRFAALSMLAGIALMLIVSLLVNAVVTALSHGLDSIVPNFVIVFQIVDVTFTFALTMLLVAIIYKWLPDVTLAWKPVLAGAFVTAALFGVGELALGWYLGHAGSTSQYGAAGALVLILLWVYYSAQIFLFGAEFTKVYARVDPLRGA